MMTDWNKLVNDIYEAGTEANTGSVHENIEIAYDVYMALLTPVAILEAENAKLRAALESLRRGDKEHDNYCACGDPDGLNFCTCSSRNTNAIIDAALKGDE